MEATRGRDGGRGPSWSYSRHEEMGSTSSYTTSSSRSGTIVSISTGYTSSASRPSLSTDFELKIHGYDEHGLLWGERVKEKEKTMKRIIELVNGGVKRWCSELDVAWVLDLPNDAASAPKLELTHHVCCCIDDVPSWIHALFEIVETIRFMSTLPPPNPCSHSTGDAVPNNQFLLIRVTSKILQTVKSKLFLTNDLETDDDQIIEFARFAQEVMLKMLAFVDVLAAVDLCNISGVLRPRTSVYGDWELYTYHDNHDSLNLVLDVHGALSKALHVIHLLFVSSPPGEVQRILGEILRLLSTKKEKALDAICLTLNDTTTHVLKQIENLSLQQEESSNIHEVTLSVISHISFLMNKKSSLDSIISEVDNRGKVYIGNQTYSDGMIIRIMASRLQEELDSRSETFFSDQQDLRFLFLLNNSHRLHQCLRFVKPGWSCVQLYVESLSTKVDGYMQSYLQVSWAPVLSCLFNPTPSFLGIQKKYFQLTRFESEFAKTYFTQKQWKVPDPELRKNLRTAIIQQIIPGYTKYIEENNINTPRLSPLELQEMLQDLFEG